MNIWTWVADAQEELRKAGHSRLSEIVDRVPSLVGDGLAEEAEALVAEGLELARAIDHAWLEVFLRHWRAQGSIVNRNDVANGMDEIVRLLDFAHGERTASCPQSVCVTQDFCIAYGVLDGPGFGEERLAASAEALGRITPRWSCFGCISSEYADALLDLERFEECEAYCRQQIAAVAKARTRIPELGLKRADALGQLGRHNEALKVLKSVHLGDQHSRSMKNRLAELRAREYAALGKIDEAAASHLDAADMLPANFVHWTRSEEALCAALPGRNNAATGRALRGFVRTLQANGSLFQQGEISLSAARLALARGSGALAALHLDEVQKLLPQLRAPDRLARELARLRAALPCTVAPAAAEEELLASLGDDAERNLEALAPAHAANPASERLTLALCRAYQEISFVEHAHRELKRFALAQPDSTAAFDELLRTLVQVGDAAELAAMAQAVPDERRAKVHFYLGRLHVRRLAWHEAVLAFEESQRRSPGARAVLSNLSLVYREVGRLEESLALLEELASDGTDRSDDWDRMVVATLLNRHDKVRESSKRLGYVFEGEGPIDDWFAYCDVRIKDAVGREVSYRCWRINPVVGRILEIQKPGEPSRYRDEVLFEPVALNPPPEQKENGEKPDYFPEFRAIKVLKTGDFRTYDLDGVYPGDEAVETLSAELWKSGIVLSVRSGESYQLEVRKDEPTVRGLYAFLAVPQGVTTADAHRALAAAVAAWPLPMTFRGMLQELGLSEELARQQQIAEQLKL